MTKTQLDQLEMYGKTFFGFGDWKADVWLVGLEEWGAETEDEFCRRYQTWQELNNQSLVDLRVFCQKCGIVPEWTNRTWKTLHRICNAAGLGIPALGENNQRWGGAGNVQRNSGHIALIEAMPFPAPSTTEWPYEEWNVAFMASREACTIRFRKTRLTTLRRNVETYSPKVVIDYGGVWKILRNHGINFSLPTLFRKAAIGDTCWISPVKIAGARPFDKVATTQTVEQLRETLGQ